jgi:hypothetical protein
MKTKLNTLGAAMLLAFTVGANAGDTKPTPPAPKPGSAEFERMKTLVGSWAGKVDMGQGPVEMTATYRLIAGGSVLEERLFAGTPHEMATMYFDKAGKLSATHYCVMGNQPQMLLKSSDDKSITLDFDATCGIDPKKESHMHSLKISFDDANTVTMSCSALIDGKEAAEHPAVLTRVK